MLVLAIAVTLCVNAGLSHPAHAEEIHRAYRFALEKPANVVHEGTVSLYHYSWYGLRKFELATIKNGRADIRLSPAMIEQEVCPNPNIEAYIFVVQIADRRWYRTGDIAPEVLFYEFTNSIEALGKTKEVERGTTLVILPEYRVRRFKFIDQNGAPVEGLEVPVSIYLYDYNHCGAHFGPFLGNYLTDPAGEINVPAPAAPLYLHVRYYEPEGPGAAGEMYALHAGLRIGNDPHEVIRKTWELPRGTFRLRVERPDGAPAPGLSLIGCMKIAECGANCGGGFGSTDVEGFIEASLQPQNTQSLTLIDPEDRKRKLTDEEMKKLFTNNSVEITW